MIETKAAVERAASSHDVHSTAHSGQFVADHIIGVNHDHYFSYRLDLDVDGPNNSFVIHRMTEQRIENDPMRKSIWVARPQVAQREKDAILDVSLEHPSMWMFINPTGKGALNYPPGYEIMAGATAKSLMSADDPVQRIGAFSAHQLWVTPYKADERFASGSYPTSAEGRMASKTGQRPIARFSTLISWHGIRWGFITYRGPWPVMPVQWHSFHIRPFHFFGLNPVLDVPKSLSAKP